jgi:NAD(P)-dependent dehydrogenase (short-subunit alcohol dehydrogenase family)
MTTLEGKVAFITGASRGIGAAVGRALAERGVSLGLASRSGDDLGLADSVGVSCDVRDLAQLEDAVGRTVERFGRLDVVAAMRASAPTTRSSTRRSSTCGRWSRST